mgnify:CR=1 FL=1
MNKYYKKWFLPLSAPAIILFFLVVFVPFIIGVFYSFTAWKGTFFLNGKIATSNPFEAFVGLQNYVDAVNNEKFQIAFGNTIKFTVIAVVAINVTALLLALMLTSIKKFAGFFRVVFFMPNLLGGLALGFIWQFIFEVVFSQIFFGPDGLVSVEFLTNMTQGGLKSIFALVILVAWQMVGYMMIIYVAGLNNISDDLYEAAQIDGAGVVRTFISVMLPNARGVITTVALFAFVWQWNDVYYTSMYEVSGDTYPMLTAKLVTMSERVAALILQPQYVNIVKTIGEGITKNALFTETLLNTAALLIMTPLLIAYLFVQRLFIEGVERSGIVG